MITTTLYIATILSAVFALVMLELQPSVELAATVMWGVLGTGLVALLVAQFLIWRIRWFTSTADIRTQLQRLHARAAKQGGTLEFADFNVLPDPQTLYLQPGTVDLSAILVCDKAADQRAVVQACNDRLTASSRMQLKTLLAPSDNHSQSGWFLPNFVIAVRSDVRDPEALVGYFAADGSSSSLVIHTLNRRICRILHSAYSRLMANVEAEPVASVDEFDAVNRDAMEHAHASLDDTLLRWAQTQSSVLYVAVFGSRATALRRVYDAHNTVTEDADLNVLVVFDSKTEASRTSVQKTLQDACGNLVDVLPGLSLSDGFYAVRHTEKMMLSVDILAKGSAWLKGHELFARSMLGEFVCLYSADDEALANLLRLPQGELSVAQRRELVAGHPDGLSVLGEQIKSHHGRELSAGIDYRRICRQVLRNALWALYGSWPASAEQALQQLRDDDVVTAETAIEIDALLQKQADELATLAPQLAQASLRLITQLHAQELRQVG